MVIETGTQYRKCFIERQQPCMAGHPTVLLRGFSSCQSELQLANARGTTQQLLLSKGQ